MLVADRGGPTMFARIGVMRALNRQVERVFDPSRKEKHWAAANSRAIDEAGSLATRSLGCTSGISPLDQPACQYSSMRPSQTDDVRSSG